MNKLGFAIKFASQGAGNAIECNKGQWTSKVVDIREYLKLFNGLQGTDNIVTFISFDESGCFLTQLRAISGRIGDFLSGWIYIPNTIEATGEDIMCAYNYVRNILLYQSSINNSVKEDIEGFFSREYPAKGYVIPYLPSSGEEYGVRFCNVFYTMKEILDVDRYQSYYSSYKAIFLLDKDGDVKITKESVASFKDLTKLTINKTCIFKAPSPEEVSLLGRGTKIVFKTNKEFNSPVPFKQGEQIQLRALREGFEPFIFPIITIQDEVQTFPIVPGMAKWEKKITSSMFSVKNSKGERIKGTHVFVNGDDITFKELLLSEDDCKQATIKVTAPDYESIEQICNLLKGEQVITLHRKIKSSKMKIKLANGELADITLESKENIYTCDSPLKGYVYDNDSYNDRDRVLRMSSLFIWKQRAIGFVAALVAVMFVCACVAFDTWYDNHHFKLGLPPWEENKIDPDSVQENKSIQSEPEQQNSDSLSLKDAIGYLDSTIWTKSDMDKYPDLKGLYENMDSFKLEVLTNWYPKLEESKNFKKVYESAKKTLTRGWNPKQGSHNPTYNKSDDEQINIINYINWLDQDQSPKTPSVNGGQRQKTNATDINNNKSSSSDIGNKDF